MRIRWTFIGNRYSAAISRTRLIANLNDQSSSDSKSFELDPNLTKTKKLSKIQPSFAAAQVAIQTIYESFRESG